MSTRERRTWAALALLGLAVGVNAGMALAIEGFWLDPIIAVLSMLATVGLVATAYVAARREAPTRGRTRQRHE